jgi:hypothetical protein
MKKLLKLGAALAVLSLLFAACSDPEPEKKKEIKPSVTSITLQSQKTGGSVVTTKPAGFNPEDEVTFTAVVTGTNGKNPTTSYQGYNITITATDKDDLLTETSVSGGGKKVVIKSTATTGSFTVTATSTVDVTKTVSWENILITTGDLSLPWVTDITLLKDSTAAGEASTLNPGAFATFLAEVGGVEGDDGTHWDTTYTIEVDDPDSVSTVETVDSVGKKITIKNDAANGKTVTVTATSTGDKVDNTKATATHSITIQVSSGPNFTNPQWVIKNTALDRGVTLNLSTTTTVPTPVNRRYVIFNNEPGATVDNQTALGGNCFRDVTIMYLDVPIPTSSVNFVPFAIEARVKISKHRDTAPLYGSAPTQQWGGGRQAVVVGYIADVENPNFGQTFESAQPEAVTTTPDDAPWFHGFRVLSSGQHRQYGRRPRGGTGAGGYGSAQLTPGSTDTNEDIPGSGGIKYQAALEAHDYVDASLDLLKTKKEGFRDQEYIARVVRTGGSSQYTVVYDSSGNELFSNHPGGTVTNVPGPEMTGVDNFFAILVYGVEAEISDIKIFYDDLVNPAWVDPAVANAQIQAPTAKRVDITINNGTQVLLPGDTENDYSVSGTFPPTGVPLTAEVVPITLADRSVAWTVTGDGTLEWEEGAVWQNGTNYGQNVFTATSTVGSVTSSVKFLVQDPAAYVTPEVVTIDVPSKVQLDDNEKLILTAQVGPAGAPSQVTWSITGSDGITPVPIDVAVINSTTGELHVFTVDVNTTINVYATAFGTSIKSAAQPITIKKAVAVNRLWTFGVNTPVPDGWNVENTPTANTTNGVMAGGLTLIPPAGSNINWRPGQGSGATMGYIGANTGCLQIGAVGTIGTIKDFELPVKISIVYATTGNRDTDTRYVGVQFGSGAVVSSETDLPFAPNPDSSTKEAATFTTEGTGLITLTCIGGSIRVFEIRIEPADGVTPVSNLPYIWNAGDDPDGNEPANPSFVLAANATKLVNGVNWINLNNTVTVTATGISMPGARLVIGSASSTATSTTVMDSAAEFDFTTQRTITITYTGATWTGGNFQIYINNNTTGGANSVLGGSTTSRIYSAGLTTADGTITATINPTALGNHESLANAFVSIRPEAAITAITITSIRIE